jgi:membrane-associated phospholipid phosphatase
MRTSQKNEHYWQQPRVWGPLLLLWGTALGIWLADLNQPLFLVLNGGQNEIFWSGMTILGDTAVALALLLPFCGREPRLISALLISVIPGTLLVHGAKALFDAARPAAVLAADQIQVIGPFLSSHSFPSGHTATAFIAAGLVLLHFRDSNWFIEGFLVALLVGFSRVIVGAHWPVDVLVGAGIGWATAAMSVYWAGRWSPGVTLPVQRVVALILLAGAIYTLLVLDTSYPQAIWLQYLIAAAVIILAIPGLRCLFQRK